MCQAEPPEEPTPQLLEMDQDPVMTLPETAPAKESPCPKSRPFPGQPTSND